MLRDARTKSRGDLNRIHVSSGGWGPNGDTLDGREDKDRSEAQTQGQVSEGMRDDQVHYRAKLGRWYIKKVSGVSHSDWEQRGHESLRGTREIEREVKCYEKAVQHKEGLRRHPRCSFLGTEILGEV